MNLVNLINQRASFDNYSMYNDKAILPDMIENQRTSFKSLLDNLYTLINEYFPIESPTGIAKLEFIKLEIENPKVNYNVCNDYGITYSAPIYVTFRLTFFDQVTVNNKVTLVQRTGEPKEQRVFFIDMPLMTDYSTFLINGCEHVVISQMHRSPGIFFDHDNGKSYAGGSKYIFSASLIPYRGSWLDMEFDTRDVIYFRIDKKRKMPITTLLKACGFNTKYILDQFYKTFTCDILIDKDEQYAKIFFDKETFLGTRLVFDLIDPKTLEVIVTAGTRVDKRLITKLKDHFNDEGIAEFYISFDLLYSFHLAEDVMLQDNKIAHISKLLVKSNIDKCREFGISKVKFYLIDHYTYSSYMMDTMLIDKNNSMESAQVEICRVSRGSDASIDHSIAAEIFKNIFFSDDKYDLSEVGRVKLNQKLNIKTDKNVHILTYEDIFAIIKELIRVKDGLSDIDDIDNLSNRRVRLIGELVENQIKMGMAKLIKNASDKMATPAVYEMTPYDLVYSKFVSSMINEFFKLSQFSQFMDQTNPLAEVTHKRRISALGVGGLNRERAGFEVRDVHYTHYGRICPIETPEGANIGLINSLAVYAIIDDYGFIRTPYRKVVNSIITDEIDYLSASDEIGKNIAEISSKTDDVNKNQLVGPKVSCRCYGEFVLVNPEEVHYIDVSSKQIVSVATSLIPFLDNDDANRALMGANMQRQAVPLLRPSAPLVGTGMEGVAARDSGVMLLADTDATVKWVDANMIILEDVDSEEKKAKNALDTLKILNLRKYQCSNYNTCITQKPTVKIGENIKKGQVLADGFSTKNGDLSLGDNALVAFLSWNGFNFEDSIIVSQRLIADDIYTSVHLEEFECVVRDTRFGEERITRDIPNLSEDALLKLDESGLVHIGTHVKPGDILVGKVMPKADSAVIPEEKLLRAVFGEGATDIVDASLYLPPGIQGVVVDIKVLSRRGIEKDYVSTMNNRKLIDKLLKEMNSINSVLGKNYKEMLLQTMAGATIKAASKKFAHLVGAVISYDNLSGMNHNDLAELNLDHKGILKIKAEFIATGNKLEDRYAKQIKELTDGYGLDLAHGVLKTIKVRIATKSKLQAGDKMSGRHGNKGVVSLIAPIEDMPYMEDGTPIDIILSPLGIPSRMNMGQVLEVHMGLALFAINRQVRDLSKDKPDGWMEKIKNLLSHLYHRQPEMVRQIESMTADDLVILGESVDNKVAKVAIPVFSGMKDDEISNLLKVAGCDETGQVDLYDGFTGEKIHRKVTVGIMYILKLHHMVDNKIHARSIGPYSLVTQQPLGGRSHFGGQRFGEMECWALQAYGAAYTLQEMLTVKSDDVIGRVMAYDSIIRGENIKECGIPESFNVIVKELLSLCINVELLDSNGNVVNTSR